MTNHSYFNLAGDPSKTSTDNIMYVNADYYTPVDSTFMTTGEIAPVKDTPMDFTTPKAVGKDINNYDFVQLKNGNGYDHNWVLNTKGDIFAGSCQTDVSRNRNHIWKYIPTNRVFRYTQVTSSTEP